MVEQKALLEISIRNIEDGMSLNSFIVIPLSIAEKVNQMEYNFSELDLYTDMETTEEYLEYNVKTHIIKDMYLIDNGVPFVVVFNEKDELIFNNIIMHFIRNKTENEEYLDLPIINKLNQMELTNTEKEYMKLLNSGNYKVELVQMFNELDDKITNKNQQLELVEYNRNKIKGILLENGGKHLYPDLIQDIDKVYDYYQEGIR